MAFSCPAMQVLLIVLALSCMMVHGMRFAVLSDLHIGESSAADDSTLEAIKTVNSIVSSQSLSFVIITGDITSSALPSQYQLARQMLDTLTIPYYPIFGNHDVWVYSRPTNETSWQEKVPTGDAVFAKYFEDIFIRDNITYNFNTVWNPEQKINSTFLNWEMRIPSPAGTFVLFGLDFVTREGATNPKDLYKGGAPTASLHDFPNGTLRWFEERLDLLPADTVSVVTAHHHTVVTTPFFTPDYFSMNENDRRDFREVLTHNGRPSSLFWGALVGHMHFWDDQKALFGTYRQWETTAAKQDGANAIAIVEVDNGSIINIQRCCGVSESAETMSLARKTVLSACLFIFAIWIYSLSHSFSSLLCSFPLKVLSFISLAASQVIPLIGGNAFVTKHINANYVGPILILIVMIYGITKNRLSRVAILGNLSLFLGTALIDVTRYPIRTSWVRDGENFNVFWVYITCIIALLIQAFTVRNQSRAKWMFPLISSFILGILMELLGATVSSVLYRMLSPITLSFYETLEHITIASLVCIIVGQFVVVGIIAKRYSLLYCVPIVATLQTICNTISQLGLRTNSYPIPYVYWTVMLSIVPLVIGIVILSEEQRLAQEKQNNSETNGYHKLEIIRGD